MAGGPRALCGPSGVEVAASAGPVASGVLEGWIGLEEIPVTASAAAPGPVMPDVALRAASCELGPSELATRDEPVLGAGSSAVIAGASTGPATTIGMVVTASAGAVLASSVVVPTVVVLGAETVITVCVVETTACAAVTVTVRSLTGAIVTDDSTGGAEGELICSLGATGFVVCGAGVGGVAVAGAESWEGAGAGDCDCWVWPEDGCGSAAGCGAAAGCG